MQKLRALLPRGSFSASSTAASADQPVDGGSLEPEIGFQITIESHTINAAATANGQSSDAGADAATTRASTANTAQLTVPQLNVHLIAARHLPTLFGFKIVQGYLIKVKLFPGSKRLDSSIQTNSWPKFNENFRFPLLPDRKPAMKQATRRSSRASILMGTASPADFTPEELFEGQFVVFTVYALLELPPVSFNRLNKTYRSLRDKGSSFVQKVVDSTNGTAGKDDKENTTTANGAETAEQRKSQKKRRTGEAGANPRDAMPPLTISESRRNIGSVTCYLEAKLFRRQPRTGQYATEELWLPVKDITTSTNALSRAGGVVAAISSSSNNNNNPTNAPKGVVEIVLELHDLAAAENGAVAGSSPESPCHSSGSGSGSAALSHTSDGSGDGGGGITRSGGAGQWSRVRSEMRRKMGISNASKPGDGHQVLLRVTTARMRCSQKVKDELEATAGSVYVKTTLYEHGIYVDSWKSPPFFPSLSTKWSLEVPAVGGAGVGGGGAAPEATLSVPLPSAAALEHLLVRTTLATKTKLGKKLVLGTVLVGAHVKPHGLSLAFGGAGGAATSGAEHVQALLQAPLDERVPMWHCFQ